MKRAFFIGQAPARPGSKHEVAGVYLRAWLYGIGLTEEAIQSTCRFDALAAQFPGHTKAGHLAPTPADIQAHRPQLIAALREWQPDIVVPVGKMAIHTLIGQSQQPLTEIIGKRYTINPLDALTAPVACIPIPHPSGRSVWNVQHPTLIARALTLLQQELGEI